MTEWVPARGPSTTCLQSRVIKVNAQRKIVHRDKKITSARAASGSAEVIKLCLKMGESPAIRPIFKLF